MISAEDRLRVCAFLQAEFGKLDLDLAEILYCVTETRGVEVALQDSNRALAHPRLQVGGEPKAADAPFEEAKRLWQSGSDPAEVLDPGRLFHLEAPRATRGSAPG